MHWSQHDEATYCFYLFKSLVYSVRISTIKMSKGALQKLIFTVSH